MLFLSLPRPPLLGSHIDLFNPSVGNPEFQSEKSGSSRDSALATVTARLRGKQKSSVAGVHVPDKQKATSYEIMADAYLHLSRWRKVCMSLDVYSQKSSASTHELPTKDTIQSYLHCIHFIETVPQGQMCFHTVNIQGLSSSLITLLSGPGQYCSLGS